MKALKAWIEMKIMKGLIYESFESWDKNENYERAELW